MTYIEIFVCPVPAANKKAYIARAKTAAESWKRVGALRIVEGWGDNVPDGIHTSFIKAVKCEKDEVVVSGWIEWPDKATRDKGFGELMEQYEKGALNLPMPFDGKRVFAGGFRPILDI